jgi:hypothetical protein
MAGATETSTSEKNDDAKAESASRSGASGSGDDGSRVGALDADTRVTSSSADRTATEEAGVPLLPPPDPNSGDSVPKIKLGETISFEEMGPVIINADGTARRIDNWDQMTVGERQVAWRRISQRNEERRRKMLEQQDQQKASGAPKDGEN